MLATYKLLEKHKSVLADLIYELGEVDVDLSVQKLVEESKAYSSENNFTLGDIVTSKQKNAPHIEYEENVECGHRCQEGGQQ